MQVQVVGYFSYFFDFFISNDHISNRQSYQSVNVNRIIIQMQGRGRSRSSSQSSYKDQRDHKGYIQPSTRLFIGGISNHANPDDLRNMLENIGQIENFFVKKPEEGNRDLFGFVTMGSLKEAEEAINALNGKMLCQKMIFVKYAKPRIQKQEGSKHEGKDNFTRGPREDRNRPQETNRFRGQQEERPRWNRNGEENQQERGGDKRQGFGRQNNYQNGPRNFGNREGNDYQKQEDREAKNFDGGNRGQGGFSKPEASYQPPSASKKASEDFDY